MKIWKPSALLVFYLISTTSAFAQGTASSSTPPIPSDARFYESYQIEETVKYLIPDNVNLDQLTDWDWVDFKPLKEVSIYTAYIDANYDRFTEIEILESNRGNEWDDPIKKVVMGPRHARLYDASNHLLFERERPQEELLEEARFTEILKDSGLYPQQKIQSYQDALQNDELVAQFSISPTVNGYTLINSQWRIKVNVQAHTVIKEALMEVVDQPFHIVERFIPNSQGYLMPMLSEKRYRVNSKNGHELIRSERKVYSNSQLYYHPSVLASEKVALAASFSLSPNPASANLSIHYSGNSLNNEDYAIQILNQTKDVLLSQSSLNTSQIETVNLSNLPPGFYLIQFSIKDQFFSKKFFKN